MPKIQNTFSGGLINKDLDSRFVPSDALIDAENFIVATSDGSDQGVGRNVQGNLKKTSYNIDGAKTIGKGTNPAKEKLYNFIKGDSFDYIMEYDTVSETSVTVCQTSTGGALNFIEGERILNVDVITDPEGNGDLLAFSGDSNPPRILNIERAKLWGVDGFTKEEIMLIKAPPLFPPSITPVNSVTSAESNNLEDIFISFSYRYRYKDGYYSCVSSWSKYFFTPGAFALDFETFENLGMLSIINSAMLSFDTGPREVERVDLVFKLSNSSTIYLIDKFNKNEEGWADNTTQTLEFNNSKVYSILPESEYFRSFDNVPEAVFAQTTAGNRAMYANYLEGKNLIDKNGNDVIMNYVVDYISNNIANKSLDISEQSVTYSYEDPPVEIAKAEIRITFAGNEFISGSSIFINFNIKANSRDIIFEQLFSYFINGNYSNLADFLSGSDFINALEEQFMQFFIINGGIVLPDNYVPDYEILQGFTATSSGNTLILRMPVIKYEIDNFPDPNTFIYDYFINDRSSSSYQNISVASSMKSRRSYEICMIYRDLQGRKTTALTSEMNTVFIPNSASVFQNQIKVSIPDIQKPPIWADTYKFGIKVNKGIYEQIIASIFFEDGIYRWIKLDVENINKVKEGDILTVKKDSLGAISEVIKIKVLELKQQPKNFLENNSTSTGSEIIEPAGLYMKIKPKNFEMSYDENEFIREEQYKARKSGRPILQMGATVPIINRYNESTSSYEDIPIGQGSTIRLFFNNYESDGTAGLYERYFTVQDDYDNFEQWFNAEVDLPLNSQIGEDFSNIFFSTISGGLRVMNIEAVESGSELQRSKFNGIIEIRRVDGFFIFETEPIEVDNALFYETPEIFQITDGEHQQEEHILTETFNCFSFGNGAESYQIRDAFNEKYISIDFCPTAVSEDNYGQVNRYADITYSGVYNANTNINKLNEFNASLANFKDDIEKGYGPIIKIKGQDTNLEVYQEDKDSIVYYGKDLLFNADGSTNLARIEEVLGQQKTYEGEFGISYHPDSFDDYGFNSYHTDTKRGVVIKKSNNGLFEISKQGMRNYFKTLFRDNKINHINGKYDQFYDLYILNIQYNNTEYVTWLYSDILNGWLTRHTFNPEDMVRINGQFYSFKNGEIWLHNSPGIDGLNHNTFYGEEYPSKFIFNFSQNPSERKRYENIEIEGTDSWKVSLLTDLDNGYINKADFEKKEGNFYAYARTSNAQQDTSMLNYQGVGEAVVNGNILEFNFVLDTIFSVGDEVRNANLELVGKIIGKTEKSFIMDSVSNLSSGQYVVCVKPSSIENAGLLGYHMQVSMELSKTGKTEIYAVNSEIDKSFM